MSFSQESKELLASAQQRKLQSITSNSSPRRSSGRDNQIFSKIHHTCEAGIIRDIRAPSHTPKQCRKKG